jgi:hypothetical protein
VEVSIFTVSRPRVRRNFFQRWEEPGEHEPANAYFSRMAGRNLQTSARVFAQEMGLDGRQLPIADCLDAVRHLPIVGMDRLIAATPVVTKRTVQLLGQTVRRRHWSGDEPRWCPGCIAESSHYRTYHGLIDFTVCPFHGCAIAIGTGGDRSLSWRHPSMAYTPDGTRVGRQVPRSPEPSPSFERWLLGRLGVLPPWTVPLLEGVPLDSVLDTVSLLGRAATRGWSRTAPRIGHDGLSRQAVVAAGYGVLTGGIAAIEALFERIAAEAEGRIGPRHQRWGLNHSYGWLFQAIIYGQRAGSILPAVKAAVMTDALRRGVFARSTTAIDAVALETNALHRDEVAHLVGVQPRYVDTIARRIGIRPDVQAGRFVMYARADALRLRREIEQSLPRQAAIVALGLARADFDALEAGGSIRPLCRLGGGSVAHERFRPVELEALLPMTPALTTMPADSLTCAAFAAATGLSFTRVILAITRRMIVPVARDPTSPGFQGLRLAQRDVAQFAETEIPLLRRGGRERRAGKALGLPHCDAATTLGVGIDTVQALLVQGFIAPVPAIDGVRSRIDPSSLDAFRARYAPAAEYADVLGCARPFAMGRLQKLGIAIHVRTLGEPSNVSAFVERLAVMRVLGLDDDPLAEEDAGWKGFWRGFGEHLAKRKSIFRLVAPVGRPEARLMSGDRRTSCLIRVSVEAAVDAEGAALPAEPRPPARASWLNLYPRLAALAYEQRAGAPDQSRELCEFGGCKIELAVISRKHRKQRPFRVRVPGDVVAESADGST